MVNVKTGSTLGDDGLWSDDEVFPGEVRVSSADARDHVQGVRQRMQSDHLRTVTLLVPFSAGMKLSGLGQSEE